MKRVQHKAKNSHAHSRANPFDGTDMHRVQISRVLEIFRDSKTLASEMQGCFECDSSEREYAQSNAISSLEFSAQHIEH